MGQVGKDDLDGSKAAVTPPSKPLTHPLVNQYSLTLGQDLGLHDTKSLIKCVDSLSFIVRDAAHVTPENFELCVKAIRVFVEASLNGGTYVLYNEVLGSEFNRGCGINITTIVNHLCF